MEYAFSPNWSARLEYRWPMTASMSRTRHSSAFSSIRRTTLSSPRSTITSPPGPGPRQVLICKLWVDRLINTTERRSEARPKAGLFLMFEIPKMCENLEIGLGLLFKCYIKSAQQAVVRPVTNHSLPCVRAAR